MAKLSWRHLCLLLLLTLACESARLHMMSKTRRATGREKGIEAGATTTSLPKAGISLATIGAIGSDLVEVAPSPKAAVVTSPVKANARSKDLPNSRWPLILRASVFPVGLLLVSVAFVALFAPRPNPDEDLNGTIARQATWCLVLCRFIVNASFASVIVDSLDYIGEQGGSEAISGIFVGIQKGMQFIGMIALWLVCRFWPDTWRMSFQVAMSSYAISFFGAIMSTSLNIHCLDSLAQDYPMVNKNLWLVIISRGIQGIGAGAMGIVTKHVINELSPAHDKVRNFTKLSLASTLGLGAGPLLSTLGHYVDDYLQAASMAPNKATAFFLIINMTQMVLFLTMIFAVWFLMPRSMPETRASSSSTAVEEAHLGMYEKLMMCTCISISGCRGFVVSSVEVATAMILESPVYGWAPKNIAILLSCTFMGCIPITLSFWKWRPTFGDHVWMRGGFVVCLLMCPCYSQMICQFAGACSVGRFAFADAITIPTILLLSGIGEGLVMKYAKSGTGMFSSNNAILLQDISIDCIGRNFGPGVARHIIGLSLAGLDMYSLSQFAFLGFFWGLSEMFVRPFLHVHALPCQPDSEPCCKQSSKTNDDKVQNSM